MAKVLSQAQIERYERDGFFFPIAVLGGAEVAGLRARLESFETGQGRPIEGSQRSKAHLLFKWLDDLMRDGRILDVIEDLIGPDLLCWNTIFWIKEAGAPSYVSWHQDLNYWGLDADDMITAWIALSAANAESGCMRVLPASHKGDMLPHDDGYHPDNMLTRGQEIAHQVDESKAVAMPLEAGEMSIHNVRIAHASGPNHSDDRRIGISLHYMPTRARQLVGEWDSAALVRGQDLYHHFAPTPVPRADMDPEALAFRDKATRAVREILYQDAAQRTARLG